MLPNPTTEETAEEPAQRVNAKRLAAKERKTAQLEEDQPGQRESKRIKTENDSDDYWGWVRMDTPAEVFPDHPLLEEHERLVAPIEDSPKEPPFRVTFTFPLLNAAKLCVFALSGDSKSDMVARILQNQEDFLAGRVYPLVGTVLWLLDQRAASQLEVTLET
ncbi:6-phosphogluconolactonase-like [Artemia franciscana]|uniref:6-phosphogluconolactonase-like n=1 Tax=Artemia franciscana TaxID=6661 RepID=UPI0032DB7D05